MTEQQFAGPTITHPLTFGTEKRVETQIWRVVVFVAPAFVGPLVAPVKWLARVNA
jgi:hypothetical protein